MNRLNNINRVGIYPVTKETLSAIEDNFQMLSRVLDGLHLPQGTAVILHGLPQVVSYMYLQPNRLYAVGKIVKVNGTGVAGSSEQWSARDNLLKHSSDFVLTTTDVSTDIIGTDGVTTYEDCLIQEQCTITYSAGVNTTWKYHTLEDILGLSREKIANDAFSLPSQFSIVRNNTFVRNMLQKHLHIELEIAKAQIDANEIEITISGTIKDIIGAVLSTGNTFCHPVQVSAVGCVASGYIVQGYGDNTAKIVCYKQAVVYQHYPNKMQITGDIYL